MSSDANPVLIVGAGPAGLATAAELSRRRVSYRLLERGPTIAHTWENLYDSLTLHTGKHMSTLPGMSYSRATGMFPTRRDFLDYLQEYQRRKNIVAETGREVVRLQQTGREWEATLASGEVIAAPAVVMATGIVAKPRLPDLAGREGYTGRVMHSAEYRRPAGFEGQRVLVVGVGNSGGEIGAELARHGAQVTALVRSGQNVVPKQLGPLPAQYVRYVVGKLPRRVQEVVFARVQKRFEKKFGPPVLPRPTHSVLDAIPLIGFSLVDCIKEGLVRVQLGRIERLTERGATFSDGTHAEFDVILLATGFEAALDPLGVQVRRDVRGFAVRSDRVTSADCTNLWLVGQNYDHTGGLTNIRIDARLSAAAIAAQRLP